MKQKILRILQKDIQFFIKNGKRNSCDYTDTIKLKEDLLNDKFTEQELHNWFLLIH